MGILLQCLLNAIFSAPRSRPEHHKENRRKKSGRRAVQKIANEVGRPRPQLWRTHSRTWETMTAIRYFGVEECREFGFAYIYSKLTHNEPAPHYEDESNGMAELVKVLAFTQNDLYYPSFEEKCAYLICSIAGSQYFSNGNKRLSVTVLLMFLIRNNVQVLVDEDRFQQLMRDFFHAHIWEVATGIDDPHSQFLYNLSMVIGDRNKWGTEDFAILREWITSIFSVVHKRG